MLNKEEEISTRCRRCFPYSQRQRFHGHVAKGPHGVLHHVNLRKVSRRHRTGAPRTRQEVVRLGMFQIKNQAKGGEEIGKEVKVKEKEWKQDSRIFPMNGTEDVRGVGKKGNALKRQNTPLAEKTLERLSTHTSIYIYMTVRKRSA